jgi:hypothetical protein
MQKEVRDPILDAFNASALPNLPEDAPDDTDVPLLVTFKLGDLKRMARSKLHFETVTKPALGG